MGHVILDCPDILTEHDCRFPLLILTHSRVGPPKVFPYTPLLTPNKQRPDDGGEQSNEQPNPNNVWH